MMEYLTQIVVSVCASVLISVAGFPEVKQPILALCGDSIIFSVRGATNLWR